MKIDFALERIRGLQPDSSSEEFLLEIAWLYDRIVRAGSTVPVVEVPSFRHVSIHDRAVA